jgi:ABC-type molybdate transport system substrate-binding protein
VTQNDVLVSGAPVIEDATRRGLIKAPSRMSLGRNRLALATLRRSNAAPAKDAGSLIGAGPLAVADPSSIAGIDSAAALAMLDLRAPYPFKLVAGADAEDVAFLVTDRQARFGLLHVTEILASSELSVATRFPAAEREGYAAAISSVTRSPNAVRFMGFLRSPVARTHLQAAGIEDLA